MPQWTTNDGGKIREVAEDKGSSSATKLTRPMSPAMKQGHPQRSSRIVGAINDVSQHCGMPGTPASGGEDNIEAAVVTSGKISPHKLLREIKKMEIQIRSIVKNDQVSSMYKRRCPVKDISSSYTKAHHMWSMPENHRQVPSVAQPSSESSSADIRTAADEGGEEHNDEASAKTSAAMIPLVKIKLLMEAESARSLERLRDEGKRLKLLESGLDGNCMQAQEENCIVVPSDTSSADSDSAIVALCNTSANQHHQRKRWIDSDWGHVLADSERRASDTRSATNVRCVSEQTTRTTCRQSEDEACEQRRVVSHIPRPGKIGGHFSSMSSLSSLSSVSSTRPSAFCPPGDSLAVTGNFLYR